MQQRFAVISGIELGASLWPFCPFRPTIAAVTLPLPRALFTRPVIAGTIIARALFTGPVIAGTVVALAQFPLAAVTTPIITGPIIAGPIITAVAAIIGAGITSLGLIPGVIFAGVTRFAVAVHGVIIKAVAALAAIIAAFGLTIPIIAEHTVIMFGILQIIFCRHPITGLLRIARQRPVFFQQLGGIAPLAIVQPRAIIVATSHLLRARTIVAATAPPPLVVPDQDPNPRCLALSGR